MSITLAPPLGLYIHLPWCAQKCPYCDFNSYQAGQFDERAYISKLIEDLQLDLPLIWGRQISSVFIGGGTPSLFSGDAIAQLLSDLRACLNLNPAIEITLEANPGSADESRFIHYRQAGINRLSLGIQSFHDSRLSAIGRIHDGQQAISAFEAARKAGFDNINVDLMYGLPGQDLAQAMADVQQAVALQPEHISHYQLTLEPNTRFHHLPPPNLPDDDLSGDMQQHSQQLLGEHGYLHYEISAYAKAGRHSQHNLNYWMFGDYVGIGAGAHGKITLAGENRIIRSTRLKQPRAWLETTDAALLRQQTTIGEQDRVFEFMLNALRLVQGFEQSLFSERCGLPLHAIRRELEQAKELGLVDDANSLIKPTRHGLRFHNDLQAMFLGVNILTLTQAEPSQDFISR